MSFFQIPVFKGASKPILGVPIDAGHFHGQDGLGDAPDPSAPGLDQLQGEGAVQALVRIVNEHPGEAGGTFLKLKPLFNTRRHSVRVDYRQGIAKQNAYTG